MATSAVRYSSAYDSWSASAGSLSEHIAGHSTTWRALQLLHHLFCVAVRELKASYDDMDISEILCLPVRGNLLHQC